jgi:hypothetical protein
MLLMAGFHRRPPSVLARRGRRGPNGRSCDLRTVTAIPKLGGVERDFLVCNCATHEASARHGRPSSHLRVIQKRPGHQKDEEKYEWHVLVMQSKDVIAKMSLWPASRSENVRRKA